MRKIYGLGNYLLIAVIIFMSLFSNSVSIANAEELPEPGRYSFINAVKNPDGTATTQDGFFIIDRYDGSGMDAPVDADEYGAFIKLFEATGTEYTSYLEVRVAATGSFVFVEATIGEFQNENKWETNNFTDVYLAGFSNGVKVCETSKISSIGKYETEYEIDYSPCTGKIIDMFQVYYTVPSDGIQSNFNLVDFTLDEPSYDPAPPAPQDSTVYPTTATFDKYDQDPDYADVTVTITPNGNTLVAVKLGSVTLTENVDYTVNGNVVTLKKEYLATLGTGNHVFVFDMSAGVDPTLTVTVTDSTPSNRPKSPGRSTSTPANTPKNTGVIVLVNGKAENAGIAKTEELNGRKVTTVTIDEDKLQQRLEAEGEGAVIAVPTMDGEVVVGELNGRMVKTMENQQAVVEIRTEQATYTLPAAQINIDAIAERFGTNLALQDIKVRIEIAEPLTDTVRIVEDAANHEGLTLVVPPLNFKVSAVYGGRTVEVAEFNAYVQRTIAIPEGIDPNRITTGVVVEPDGTVRHVPTKVIQIDGKYYAQINSLTNSTYAVVWNPLEFKDMGNHWAKEAVNNMGARMVVEGTGNLMFSPDLDIARAEFVAIVVRGLGLHLENGENIFADVKQGDWHYRTIHTAYRYGLINDLEGDTFRPNERITREEAMYIIANAMNITGLTSKLPVADEGELLSSFTDADIASEWAKSSIAKSVQAGIVFGRGQSALAPKAFITRAEAAVLIQRLLEKSDLI